MIYRNLILFKKEEFCNLWLLTIELFSPTIILTISLVFKFSFVFFMTFRRRNRASDASILFLGNEDCHPFFSNHPLH